MDMIWHDLRFEDFRPSFFRDAGDDFFQSLVYGCRQNFAPILGTKYDMVLATERPVVVRFEISAHENIIPQRAV